MTKKVMGMAVAVLILAIAVPALNAQPTMLLEEDFNGAWIPPGWEVIEYCNSGFMPNWSQYSYGYPYDNGPYAAYVWWAWDPSDEWLITPQIDLTEVEPGSEVLFGFNCCFYHTQANHNYVCVGIAPNYDALMPQHIWIDTIADLTHDYGDGNYFTMMNDYPNPFEFDLSAYAGQVIAIGFNYYWDGYDPPGHYRGIQAVDDVWLSAEAGGGPPAGDTLDLEMKQIIRPNTEEEGGVAFTPGCRIFNNLDTVANAKIRCLIKDLSDNSTVYEDILNSFPLDPGYTEVQTFRSFTPDINMNYEALFVVEHPDDPHPENDDMWKRFSTAGLRVNPIDMLSPDPEQYNEFSPSATYMEMAGQPSVTANLICTIEDMAYGAVVYSDTLADEVFDSAQSRDITFAQVSGLANGSYQITFKAVHLLKGEISNPALVESFTYTGIGELPEINTFSLEVAGNNVRFTLGENTDVNLRVYDVAGNMVADLASGSFASGSHTAAIDGLVSGVYFVKLVTPFFTDVAKVTVVK
ncbi:T9SS type A sorting domain-containing protein [candidate division WOR-3 bacterium]|uniref:T9SS type A sorting domain-containing protein n=1 Tax=candidate division WOR-3 bacterium TaxID=2052148 RepID=A0A9D5KB09_UNCW3|nr:T9SS type A sorting domain-containing protein [candidate division WOR-3 bacterium]MBD3364461.1 T9SS type A sorting domain-containing protein [candidate division WOR-3 bacterium]